MESKSESVVSNDCLPEENNNIINNNNNNANNEWKSCEESLRQEISRMQTMIEALERIKDKLIVCVDECRCESAAQDRRQSARREILELIADYDQMKSSHSQTSWPEVTHKPEVREKRKYMRRVKRAVIACSGQRRRGRPKRCPIENISEGVGHSWEQDFQSRIQTQSHERRDEKSKALRGRVRAYESAEAVKVYKSVTIGDQVFACLRSSDQLFHCEWPDCGKSFGQKGNIVRHYAVHGADKEYKCSYPDCIREFADSSTLKRHLLVHSGKKPFECDWPSCGYKCNSHSGLKVHKRRHTGEKPYKCDWPGCCAAFTSASNLIEHRRTHTGEKPYRCDWPGCTFQSSGSSDLKKHRRIHTGEKPYKCEWPGCTSRTGTSSEMKQHRRTHTGERPYKCDFPGCEFNASHATVIRKHKRSRHKI